MSPRRRATLQGSLEWALHGMQPGRGPEPPRFGAAGRLDEALPEWELGEWELVVSAAELALLGTRLDTPPAHLALRLAQLAGPERPGHGDCHAP